MCMGGARGGDTEAEKDRTRSIDRQIKEDEKRLKKEVKLLLLGKFSTRWREGGGGGSWSLRAASSSPVDLVCILDRRGIALAPAPEKSRWLGRLCPAALSRESEVF